MKTKRKFFGVHSPTSWLASALAIAFLEIAVASYSMAVRAEDKPAKFGIRTISTHPDRLSGGDVLVAPLSASRG